MLKSYEATFEHGQFKWLGDAPHFDNARVIVTVLEEIQTSRKRQPPASIAGKSKTIGDIVSPIDEADWECLK